jgi:hypothetical protein
MSRQSATTTRTSALRDRIALGLMLLSALGALYAFATAIGATSAAGPATQQVEAWRALGYLMFAAIFVLMGLWPRRYPYLWEVVIVNKAALTIVEVVLIGKGAVDAQSSALVDGILTVLLVAAYLLSRSYASWWGEAARTS